jgi:tetratricopeptide (TPR) repeat protein
LLQQAHVALARGNVAEVEAWLSVLGEHPDAPEQGRCLLEVDLALYRDDYAAADSLLDTCDAEAAPVSLRRAQLALERRDAELALELASQALLRARESGDAVTEAAAMVVVALAQRRLGRGVQASRSAQRALGMARSGGEPQALARALMASAECEFRQGRLDPALAVYHEARSVALEHGLTPIVAEALHWISWIQSYQGDLLDALATSQEAVSLWRDLHLDGREASTLQSVAYSLALLGRTGEALRAMEQAQAICQRMGEPVRYAINEYHIADTMLYHDEALAQAAADRIAQALQVFRERGETGWEAAVLLTRGYAFLIDGDPTSALADIRKSCSLYEEIGELGMVPEAQALQGIAVLGLGETEEALRLTREALLAMAQGEVSDEAIPAVHYARATALLADGQEERARSHLVRAYEHMLGVASQLGDEAARQAFFHHNPTTRRLMREVYAHGIASPPDSGVVSRKVPSARGGDPLQVRWTVDAGPADVALEQALGSVGLRRARLARLLAESQRQGALPTAADLAAVLNVSKRTIQRDLAALRQAD